MKFADHPFPFQLAHRIERDQTIRIQPHELRIVTAVGDFIILAFEIIAAFDIVGTLSCGGGTLNRVRIPFGNQPAVGNKHQLRFG